MVGERVTYHVRNGTVGALDVCACGQAWDNEKGACLDAGTTIGAMYEAERAWRDFLRVLAEAVRGSR